MLNEKDINYYLNFIYCFNLCCKKNEQKIDNNKNIFENIFYYMGKYNEKDKEIEIEFI